MRLLLITLGSHGDVHPFVGIAQALKRRGHNVAVMTNPHFGPLVERAGIAFEPVGSVETFNRGLDDPDVWHPHKGPARVMHGVAETLEETFNRTAEIAPRMDAVVGSSLCLGSLSAAEKMGFPYATAHLAPICVRSTIELPTLPGGVNLSFMPAFMKRKFWDGADEWFIDPNIAPALNKLRTAHGLPAVKHVLGSHWNAPMLTLGLWPDWFGPRLPDHPDQLRLTGFPLYDEADITPISSELDAWLNAGDAPIAFTPGSAMKHGRSFFQSASDACVRIGRRGILLTRHDEQIPAKLPDGVIHVPYAPFGALLPRVAVMVHHGGIGTTAQCLRAGVRQCIMPMTHDQPDNASRCVKLGVARTLPRWRFSKRALARTLGQLLTDPNVARATQDIARRFHPDPAKPHPLDLTCQLIEELAARANSPQTPEKS
jgi:rhamnosyltransferase subunit B